MTQCLQIQNASEKKVFGQVWAKLDELSGRCPVASTPWRPVNLPDEEAVPIVKSVPGAALLLVRQFLSGNTGELAIGSFRENPICHYPEDGAKPATFGAALADRLRFFSRDRRGIQSQVLNERCHAVRIYHLVPLVPAEDLESLAKALIVSAERDPAAGQARLSYWTSKHADRLASIERATVERAANESEHLRCDRAELSRINDLHGKIGLGPEQLHEVLELHMMPGKWAQFESLRNRVSIADHNAAEAAKKSDTSQKKGVAK